MSEQLQPANPSAINRALAVFDPRQFGLQPHRQGWIKEFPGIGKVAFAPLFWPHAQVHSFDDSHDEYFSTNALGLLVRLQQLTWGFPPEETVPVNVLATTQDTGGAVIAAYDMEKGWNAEGWLGFAIGMGTRSGVLYSHMLGVQEERRGSLDLGWYLKVLQGYLALKSGHHAMTWTYDPLRGANARLNLEKLAARMVNLTIDKYGVMRSSLYGDVPTDRFSAYWDLCDPAVHQRLRQVRDGHLAHFRPADIEAVPEATPVSVYDLLVIAQPEVKYRIPGDVDALMHHDPAAAVEWRQQMRTVLGALMTTRQARLDEGALEEGPIAVGKTVTQGAYDATRFATWCDEDGERTSFYLLERREDASL